MASARDKGLEAVNRVLSLIEVLADVPQGLGVVALAKRVGMAPSTTYRYVTTLQKRNIVEQDDNKRYCLAPHLYYLGLAARAGFDLEIQARPVMRVLADDTGESVSLMVRDGFFAVCISQLESRHQLKITAQVGGRQDLRVGATTRVLLAHAPAELQEQVFAQGPIPRYTPNTITDLGKIRTTLTRIVRDGYYLSRGERDPGVIAVAAPVRDRFAEVIAAIVVAAPEIRIRNEEAVITVISLVKRAAEDLSLRLGFSPARETGIVERRSA